MMSLELALAIVLIALACGDLIVGVVNDAVNFTQSSIGSRAASRNIILVTAGVGVLVGSLFSDGIIEVTRKGIFHPGFFEVVEVMMIFTAVVLADVLLLDFYSTYGLPTSTTVSVVFEILGASFVMALWKMGWVLDDAWKAINASSVGHILYGIILSVVLALVAGLVVQAVSRLFFTFHYEKRLRKWGFLWCGAVLSAIVYFILLKGSSHAFFMTADLKSFIAEQRVVILWGSFLFLSFLSHILLRLRFPLLKVIVLLGTASLGMAFAGNDLANFIGVSVGGVYAFLGADLEGVLRTPWWVLLLAGAVMMLTMYLSRKIHTVTKTELHLASHHNKVERRWKAYGFAESTVRFVLVLYSAFVWLLPDRLMRWFESRWNDSDGAHQHHDYDLIRASVNLFVAASLISYATSQKLPLSTTFVTFTVAMGTSLADGAWTRDTAANRLSGMLTVIGGWFMTAFIASVLAGLTVSVLYFGKGFGLVFLLLFVAGALIKMVKVHSKREGKVEMFDEVLR